MKRRIMALGAMIMLALFMSGCDSFVVLAQFKKLSSLTLTLQKSSVQQNETITIYPNGGTQPYTLGVVAGNLSYTGTLGTVSTQSYTAGTSIGTVQIHLTDSDGQSVDSVVTILPPTPGSYTVQANPITLAKDIDLTWTYADTSIISGFRIQRSLDGVNFTNLTTVGSTVTAYTDSGLNPTQTYYYRMYAVSGQYTSLPTAILSATP